MKRLVSLFLFFDILVFVVGACVGKKAPSTNLFLSKADSIMATVPDFSGVVLLAKNGIPLYHKAFGYQNFETKRPLDTASIFELASISKQFTAMVIMQLKEANKLSYQDPLEKYVQQLPYANITVRNLLNHTSGLPDYQAIMDAHWDKSKAAGNADVIAYLKKYHPPKSFQPGEKYEYSNTGYVLLASIAEQAAGKDFIALSRDQIFQPLKMSSTDIRTGQEKAIIENFALGHIYVKEKKRFVRADSFPSSNYTIWLGNRKGPGRISSTATDLLTWDQALYSDKMVTQETLAEAFAPARLKNDSLSYYGFGWDIQKNARGKRIVKHNGDNPGYKTQIVRNLDENKTLIVLCNNAHEHFSTLVERLEKLLENE
jgi:CubicO group peptidase (beta-lactamase class C family)